MFALAPSFDMPAADPRTKLSDAALKLLGKTSWSALTLAEVARTAKVPLSSLQTIAPDKGALVRLILQRIGAETAKAYRPDRDSTDARDRVLDVTLTWFDVLQRRKPAVRSLHEGLRRDPSLLLAARDGVIANASWLLTLAQADSGGPLALRALVLAGILGRAIPIWLEDDGEMTATMARLDADLRRSRFLFDGSSARAP